MKYFLLCIGLTLLVGQGWAQESVDWQQLSQVHYSRMVDMRTGYLVEKPKFHKDIKALEGELVEISGYILPLDVSGSAYVLSRYPYAACFFCGGGGLESVMDIWFKNPAQSFELDQYVKLRGILRISVGGQGLIYLLDEAQEVK